MLAGVEDAQAMTVGIAQSCLPPKPWHVGRSVLELETCPEKPVVLVVELVALEVQRHLFGLGNGVDEVDREGGLAIRALEAKVVIVLHDQPQSQRFVEVLRPAEVRGTDRHLVEPHPRISAATRSRRPDGFDHQGVELNVEAFKRATHTGGTATDHDDVMTMVGCHRTQRKRGR